MTEVCTEVSEVSPRMHLGLPWSDVCHGPMCATECAMVRGVPRGCHGPMSVMVQGVPRGVSWFEVCRGVCHGPRCAAGCAMVRGVPRGVPWSEVPHSSYTESSPQL